jgi:hypothetical protein
MLAAPGWLWALSFPCGLAIFLLGIMFWLYPDQIRAFLTRTWVDSSIDSVSPNTRFLRRLLGLPIMVIGLIVCSYFFVGFFEPK